MKRILTLVFTLAFTLLPLIPLGSAATAYAADPYCLDENASTFLQLINDYRGTNNLQPLTASPTLGTAALLHSEDMAAQNYSSHTGLNGSTPQDRMNAAGYNTAQANFWGENIYFGSPGLDTPQAAFDWWRNSPGHNANMLSPNFTAIGIGAATSPTTNETHWTTTFGGVVDATATPCNGDIPDAAGGGGGNGGGMPDPVQGNGNGGRGNNDDEPDKPETKRGGLTITVHQCPPQANPEAGDFTHCLDIDDPDGRLINTETNQSVTLSSAPIRPELTHNYEWDALPVGTYQVDPSLPGKRWTLVNIGIASPQDHRDTAEVREGEHTYVQVFLYGNSMTSPGDDPDDDDGTPVMTDDEMDSDNDGLYDSDETDIYLTDPIKADTDGDGADDGEEVYSGTDPLDYTSQPDATTLEDSDEDGLFDNDETNVYLTDPDDADTDGDGYDDGQEVFDGTDPNDAESYLGADDQLDSDEDGLYDHDEINIYLTDPMNADSDGDGADDGLEVFEGTDPNDAESKPTS